MGLCFPDDWRDGHDMIYQWFNFKEMDKRNTIHKLHKHVARSKLNCPFNYLIVPKRN